jgi:hypothetical protein
MAGRGRVKGRLRELDRAPPEREGVNVLSTIRGTNAEEQVVIIAHTSEGTKP